MISPARFASVCIFNLGLLATTVAGEFREDFGTSVPPVSEGMEIGKGWVIGGGLPWKVEEGELIFQQPQFERFPGWPVIWNTNAETPSEPGRQFTIKVEARSMIGQREFGIVFNVVDDQNFNLLVFHSDKKTVELVGVRDGEFIRPGLVRTAREALPVGEWVAIHLMVADGMCEYTVSNERGDIFIDGGQHKLPSPTELQNGYAGLYSGRINVDTRFRGMSVQWE